MPGFDARFAKCSQDSFDELAEELELPFEWTRKGSLYLMESEEEIEAAEKFCAEMVADGMPMRILDQKEVHEDEPFLATDVLGGLETKSDGSVNPMALCFALACQAEKHGCEFILHNPVNRISREGEAYRIRMREGEVLAKNVVNCAGIHAPVIGRMVGLDIPIKARQGQILVSEQTFQVARRKVHEFGYLLAKFQGAEYERPVSALIERNGVAFVFEPTHAGNFLIGSSRRFVGEDTAAEIEVMQALAQRAIRFFPVIRDIKVVRAYAGGRPYTPDHMPIVSGTELPGFYIAAGHEGDGIGLAPVTAKSIAALIAGKAPPMELAPVAYGRFAQQRLEEKSV